MRGRSQKWEMLSNLALVIANNVNYRTNLITYVFIIKAKLFSVCYRSGG